MSMATRLLGGRRRLPDIRQAEAAECGLACLAMVSDFHRRAVGLNTLRHDYPVSMKGMTLKTLMQTAERLGFAARPLRLELEGLANLQTPAILHWDMTHFVVLARVRGNRIVVHDPGIGPRDYSLAEASSHFTGIALELTPEPDYSPPPPVRRLTLRSLFGTMPGLHSVVAQILALSLILQLYVLAAPFYMQLVIDDGIVASDTDLLSTLAVGFGLALLINIGATQLRTHIMARVQSALAFQMGAGLFRHLVRLPLSYFEKRHVGDLVSRFGSIEPIRHILAEGLITTLIDGIMAVLTAAMIFIYAPMLSLVVLAALVLYGGLRLVFYRKLYRASLDLMVARAAESTTLIETLRAIQSIKLSNRQASRAAVWMNRYAEVVEADTRMVRLKQTFHSLNDLVFGLETIVILYLGAHAVLEARMTVGTLLAFMAYKQQFVSKTSALVESAIEFRMLDLHLDRLADMAGAQAEPAGRPAGGAAPRLNGSIEVRNLSYRYAAGEPAVFGTVSFQVRAGDYVVITGPSGGGKTTLLKLMLGLLEPTEGEVLVDGIPLSRLGNEAYRDNIGVVMQDDTLLSGTIADNICFFDESHDAEQMHHCAELAGIHDDIVRMPMGYNSLIGDMGTSLSGGQRQRILLARALYRRPRILFMDEGTSNLDVETERRVSAAIQSLGLARVIIAHRPETIATASRCLVLADTGIHERRAPARLPDESAAAAMA